MSRPRAGLAVVELDPTANCARCARGRGCGAAVFAPTCRPLRLLCRSDRQDPDIGGRVTVDIIDADKAWLLLVASAYGLPTVGLLLGACMPEPYTPLTALAGLAGGLLAGRIAARSFGKESLEGREANSGPGRLDARIATVHPPYDSALPDPSIQSGDQS